MVLPCRSSSLQPLPHQVARLRVEARRGLVEEDEIGVVHQRAREHQASLHAPGELLDAAVGARLERREFEKPRQARGDLPLGDPEVAAVDEEVLAHREVGIEVVHLGHDAHPDAALARRLRHRVAEQRDGAFVRRREAEQHAQRGGLARAVGPEQAEALAALELEVEARDDLAPVVALAQAAGGKDTHGGGGSPSRRAGPGGRRYRGSHAACGGRSARRREPPPPARRAAAPHASESASGTVSSRSPCTTTVLAAVCRPGAPRFGSPGSGASPRPCPVMRRNAGATSTSCAKSARGRSPAAPRRRRRRTPPATAAVRPPRDAACVVTLEEIVGLAAPLVVRALARADAAEIEAEGGRARVDERPRHAS